MKTLAKILFVLTILIGFYSCDSDTSEDIIPTQTLSKLNVTLSSIVDYSKSSPEIEMSLKPQDKDIIVSFVDGIIDNSKIVKGISKINLKINTTKASGKQIKIKSITIDGLNVDYVSNVVDIAICDNEFCWTLINSYVSDVKIMRDDNILNYSFLLLYSNEKIIKLKLSDDYDPNYVDETEKQYYDSYKGSNIVKIYDNTLYFSNNKTKKYIDITLN